MTPVSVGDSPWKTTVDLDEYWTQSVKAAHEALESPNGEGFGMRHALAISWTVIDREHGHAALWYLAVDAAKRSQGLGSKILDYIADRCAAEGLRCICLEVEHPLHASDRITAERRIRFYQRNGFLLSDADYHQKVDWWPDRVPMCLMLRPLSDSLSSSDKLRHLAEAFSPKSVTRVGISLDQLSPPSTSVSLESAEAVVLSM